MTSTILHLPSEYQSSEPHSKFAFSISIHETRNIQQLCSEFREYEDFWLSWTFLDTAIQSEVFSATTSPSAVKDTLLVEAPSSALQQYMNDISTIGVFLCASNTLLAVAQIPLTSKARPPAFDHEWFTFEPLQEVSITASICISLSIADVGRDDEEDDYADDFASVQSSHVSLSQHTQSIDIDNSHHHYRLTISILSVSSLRHAAHLSLTFAYPYFGSSAPLHTRAVWVRPHVENRLDHATVTYDSLMGQETLQDILSSHPVAFSFQSKSHLGMVPLGDSLLILHELNTQSPQYFRCPHSNKIFSSLAQYANYRDECITRKMRKVPPEVPVYIRLMDVTLPLLRDGKEVGKMRAKAVLEDMGTVAAEVGREVVKGYKMHNGGVYDGHEDEGGESNPSAADVAVDSPTMATLQRDWELWRKEAEAQWHVSLREKEDCLRKQLEEEAAAKVQARLDDLRKSQDEVTKLEIRLRQSIDMVEKQKNQLDIKEEQMKMTMLQKTSELQLLQKRVREEAKSKIDNEVRRADTAEHRIKNLEEQLETVNKRLKESQADYENYRQHIRRVPESTLREELSKYKATVAELRGEIERERRLRSEAELEKEHYRSQMHRIALALKREREKCSVIARQELEQLRLEFLAREERYLTDAFLFLIEYIGLYSMVIVRS